MLSRTADHLFWMARYTERAEATVRIVRAILGGRGAAMPAPLWPGWLGAGDEIRPYPYDPDKARALLKEAGSMGAVLHF